MVMPECKICVLGPVNSGKSLLCKVLANQPVYPTPCYNGTEESIVRIQQYKSTTQDSGQPVNVHLWDCSGCSLSAENRQALSMVCFICGVSHTHTEYQGVDGVILVHNPSKPSHENELEQIYKTFIQPLKLPKQQCAVVSMNMSGPRTGSGITGRLGALKQHRIDVHLPDPLAARDQAMDAVDQLVAQCVAKQLLRAEDDVIAEHLNYDDH